MERSFRPWYVTGFFEGVASFTYSRSGDNVSPYFALKVSLPDLPLLQHIQSYFGGIGNIYRLEARQPARSAGRAKSTLYFRVSRARELSAIVAHFDRYPLMGAKAAPFSIWREIVAHKQRFRQPRKDVLAQLARRLSEASPRSQRVQS